MYKEMTAREHLESIRDTLNNLDRLDDTALDRLRGQLNTADIHLDHVYHTARHGEQ